MNDLTNGELLIKSQVADGVARLLWTGKSAEANPGDFLNPYLESVIQEASGQSLKLELDFTEMEYMNSSTVPPLIRALAAMNKSGVGGAILYKKSLKWQEASFKAMENVVRIQKFKEIAVRGV